MWRFCRFLVWISALGMVGSFAAQEEMSIPGDATAERPIAIEEMGDSIQTEEGLRPRYFVVDSFFYWCSDLDKMGGRWFELNMGRKLGLERGSKAEEALISACHEAQGITAGVWDAGKYVKDPDYEEKQWEFTRSKVERLAVFYRKFLGEMVAHGLPLETLEWHFQTIDAPGSSLRVDANSSDARIEFLTQVIEEFDHAFRSAEGQGS